ncbi:MAG TPA: sigma-70 family RNA polymerase sigma factor [Planctomycetota bacterium]|nr:sigma-70 family RNA polymerase sigma factor [Planctomycetota bacterium]
MPDAGRDAVGEVQRLFLRHSGWLRGFISGLLPDFDAAEDVLHETFLTASAKAAEFAPGTDFPAWARAIARLKVLEHLRAERASGRAPGLDASTVELLADSAPPDPAAWAERRAVLAGCLERIAPRARRILELRYVEGLRPPEIAARVAWRTDAVHVALSRARRALRECAERRLASGAGGGDRP